MTESPSAPISAVNPLTTSSVFRDAGLDLKGSSSGASDRLHGPRRHPLGRCSPPGVGIAPATRPARGNGSAWPLLRPAARSPRPACDSARASRCWEQPERNWCATGTRPGAARFWGMADQVECRTSEVYDFLLTPLAPLAEAGSVELQRAPTPRRGLPAGWYPDPARRHQQRFWDGRAWTCRVADPGALWLDGRPPAA